MTDCAITGAILDGVGNLIMPVGAVLAFFGHKTPDGWLLCNGDKFDVERYPLLHDLLMTDTVPDLREVALVGAGVCDTRASLAVHDVYELGEFKDDQVQQHTHVVHRNARHSVVAGGGRECLAWENDLGDGSSNMYCEHNSGRKGTVTRGKRVGVNYIIKAG